MHMMVMIGKESCKADQGRISYDLNNNMIFKFGDFLPII